MHRLVTKSIPIIANLAISLPWHGPLIANASPQGAVMVPCRSGRPSEIMNLNQIYGPCVGGAPHVFAKRHDLKNLVNQFYCEMEECNMPDTINPLSALEITAHHEAGHAVVATLLGKPISSLDLFYRKREGDWIGSTPTDPTDSAAQQIIPYLNGSVLPEGAQLYP